MITPQKTWLGIKWGLFKLTFGYWLICQGEKISGIEITGMSG